MRSAHHPARRAQSSQSSTSMPGSGSNAQVTPRSAAYAAAWTPRDRGRHLPVRVEREVDGRRTVVSHWAKHARGALLRHLLVRDGAEPTTPDELVDAARELTGTGPIGVTAPGLMTSELVTAELTSSGARRSLVLVVR